MRKRYYELTVIFTPVLKDKGLTSAIASVEKVIKKNKGKVLEFEEEGKEKLSYPIRKYHEGIYLFWKFQAGTDKVNALESELKHLKGVLRHLLVLSDDQE